MNKVLYFEGAGSETPETVATGVGNCRIRTAFHAKGGKLVYLEIMSGYCDRKKGELHGVVDFAHNITEDKDDCNESRIAGIGRVFNEYTPTGILEVVRKCGGEFDAIQVLPDLAGYRVHSEIRSTYDNRLNYNYGDDFVYDERLTAFRTEIEKECFRVEYEAREKDKAANAHQWCHSPSGGIWPNFSLWVPEGRKDVLCWHLCGGEFCGTHEIDVRCGDVRECVKGATGWTDETYGDFSKAVRKNAA